MTVPEATQPEAFFDLLIIGAGISGLGAAHRISQKNPQIEYRVLERRSRVGGTWDLFRYPGIRSDSDIFTLSFPWQPWTRPETVAQGADIREYMASAARQHGIHDHIDFDTKVLSADWDWSSDTWTVTAVRDDQQLLYRCRFLFFGTGYYSYDRPYAPELPGSDTFRGDIIHPQQWPEGYEYAEKRVVVVGSGATAISMIPTLTESAASVTLLQRSPGYVLAQREHNPINNAIRRLLPAMAAHTTVRWWNVLLGTSTFAVARRAPKATRRYIRRIAQSELPPGFDIDLHFNPSYDPWDQRLCVSLDHDLYRKIREGRLNVVTDRIDHLDEGGVVLESGERLDADLVITATGLQLELLGGIQVSVGGKSIDPHEHWAYKSHLLSDVPNLVWCIGYTNVSWTLRADTTARYAANLLSYMTSHGYTHAYPHIGLGESAMNEQHSFDLKAGYVLRSPHVLPKSGDRAPWKVRQNFVADMLRYWRNRIDESMVFGTVGTYDRPRIVRPKPANSRDAQSVS